MINNHIIRVDVDHDDSGLNYTIVYNDGEKVLLHCASDVMAYLEADEKGE